MNLSSDLLQWIQILLPIPDSTAQKIQGQDPKTSQARQSPIDIETVVRTYFLQIFRAARGTGLSEEQAEDVTQETFATFVEKIDSFEGRSHVRTWLFGILYNKLKEQRHRFDREQKNVSIDGQSSTVIDAAFESAFDSRGRWSRPPRSPAAKLEAQEVGSMISDCMKSAPTNQRLAFLLKEAEGLSSEEICKILDVSPTNLGVMLHRFRNRVRNCLQDKGVE